MKIIRSRIAASIVSLIVAAVIVLSSVSCLDRGKSDIHLPPESSGDKFPELSLIDELFRTYTLFELDEEALIEAVLKGYIAGTGDRYAEYFTEEEYKALTAENRGETVGVGISVTQNTSNNCIDIINVIPDSPAFKAGVLPGDIITYIGSGDDALYVPDVGYTMALDLLVGEEGTIAEFIVERNGEELQFSIKREKVNFIAVDHHVYQPDGSKKVGIVEISQFDLTTPTAFENAVDELKAEGCEYFIFDVRNNPGGDLNSIIAVLAFFLDDGDVVIRTSDRQGNETVEKISVRRYLGDYAGCSISKDDIGKYKDLKCAILTNENTASAAELFSAALKDHEISFTVGTLTYGKGTMQTTMLLDHFGYKGALKLTTQYYYPPFSDSYEGKGITPDVESPFPEELKDKNIYLITDEEDTQLAAAIEALENRSK